MVPHDAKEDLCIPVRCVDVPICTNLVEAFYNITLIARSYTALIISGIDEKWYRIMQRRTFAYQGPLHTLPQAFKAF